jgi:hypothetical protein
MKSRPEVQPRKILRPLKLIQNLIEQRHREFVLHCYGIQSTVINTKSLGSILFFVLARHVKQNGLYL